MNSYFIFVYLISFTIQRDFILLNEKLYNNNYESEKINIDYCKYFDNNTFHYEEISTKIKDIKNIINNKQAKDLNKYKYVYIPEIDYLEKIILFPKPTVFFVPKSILSNSSLNINDYCVVKLENKLEKNKPFNFFK